MATWFWAPCGVRFGSPRCAVVVLVDFGWCWPALAGCGVFLSVSVGSCLSVSGVLALPWFAARVAATLAEVFCVYGWVLVLVDLLCFGGAGVLAHFRPIGAALGGMGGSDDELEL